MQGQLQFQSTVMSITVSGGITTKTVRPEVPKCIMNNIA